MRYFVLSLNGRSYWFDYREGMTLDDLRDDIENSVMGVPRPYQYIIIRKKKFPPSSNGSLAVFLSDEETIELDLPGWSTLEQRDKILRAYGPFLDNPVIASQSPLREAQQLSLPSLKDQQTIVPSPIPIKAEEAKDTNDPVAVGQCVVCFTNPVRLVFGCGHTACENCGPFLDRCHLCRRVVKTRNPLYL